MSRVSENSSTAAVNYSLGKTKSQLENLQVQGANLKKIQKPSDDPAGNTDLLSIKSKMSDAKQFERNASFAKAQLNFTESTIEELADIIAKAKEIAVGQASSYFNKEIRDSVSQEVEQLRLQALSLGNKRFGNRYIFSGYKTLSKPYDLDGKYKGDTGKIFLEVSKDVFVPINLNGKELFEVKNVDLKDPATDSLKNIEKEVEDLASSKTKEELKENARELATTIIESELDQQKNESSSNIFDHLKSLSNALTTNNNQVIQSLLEVFDKDFDRINNLRAQVGSLVNTVQNAENGQEKALIVHQEQKSKIEDADVAQLFTDLEKQRNVLTATLKSGATLMNQSLLNFLK